ncbi:DUF397 domain-containing protein [Saccharothrix australiensis]|uniref:Uncharacterized protein DUF397 n=1 Tax=Saccharothrix australiensis TaxID=2072 RepID=A0A495W7A5_9PSEU|nr:DUF397 domain-containing protein [Saccharothrix australiensis]RKT57359.1 uncharacterized protein DUF397 [Saccharothrix australiensis]
MTPDFSTAVFKTSSRTDGSGTCVEVAAVPGFFAVRDSKHRDGGHVSVSARAFAALVRTLRK